MTSNINPNNIDGTYPVAGQDNNSQGFRDNFTNTKTNFQYASDEITDLQSKAVLKAALTGTTLDNNMLGSLLYNVELSQVSEVVEPLTPASSSVTIDFSAGPYQTFATNGSKSLSFSNFPDSGSLGTVTVRIYITSASHTITFPAAVSINNNGIQGINISTNVVTFAAPGYYTFAFSSSDGGTTYTVNQVNNLLTPFNNSNENLANAEPNGTSLAVTTSYFTTAATGETNTLAAGTSGQVKVLAYYAEGGTSDTRIFTVSNAGWKSSGTGTVTFTEFGQTVTLMYINSKWFVIAVGPGASDTFATLG